MLAGGLSSQRAQQPVQLAQPTRRIKAGVLRMRREVVQRDEMPVA
jgi:hypothetical protein